jgi:hypothetical protein
VPIEGAVRPAGAAVGQKGEFTGFLGIRFKNPSFEPALDGQRPK